MTVVSRKGRPSELSAVSRTAPAGSSRQAGAASRILAFFCVGLSTVACAGSLAWILSTPSDQGLNAHAFHTRLLWGGAGALLSLGSGIAGIVFWPQRRRLNGAALEPALSMYDSMTGLPTQRLFRLLLTQALARATHTRRMVAVMVVALEHCRPWGQGSGLQNMTLVVRVQAARIKGAVQSHDTVARLGEDRFAVILDGLEGAARAMTIAQDIRRTMSLPLVVEGQELLLSCRIGAAVAPFDGTECDALLAGAIQALANGQSDDAPIKFLSNVSALTSSHLSGGGLEATVKNQQSQALASHR